MAALRLRSKLFFRMPLYLARRPCLVLMCARLCSTCVRLRNCLLPDLLFCSFRSRFCNRSSSAIDTVRPWPYSALLQPSRTGQRSQSSASNSTTVPNSNDSVWPCGQVTILPRTLMSNALLANRSPFRAAHGLHKTCPPALCTDSTSELLMYARSMCNSSIRTPNRPRSSSRNGVASASGRLAGRIAVA